MIALARLFLFVIPIFTFATTKLRELDLSDDANFQTLVDTATAKRPHIGSLLHDIKKGRYEHLYNSTPPASPTHRPINTTTAPRDSVQPAQNTTEPSEIFKQFSLQIRNATLIYHRRFSNSLKNYTLASQKSLPNLGYAPLQSFHRSLNTLQKQRYFLISSALYTSLFRNEYARVHAEFNALSTPDQIALVTWHYNQNNAISKEAVLNMLSARQRWLFSHIYARRLVLSDYLTNMTLGLYVSLNPGQERLIPESSTLNMTASGEMMKMLNVDESDAFLKAMNEKGRTDLRMGLVADRIRGMLVEFRRKGKVLIKKI